MMNKYSSRSRKVNQIKSVHHLPRICFGGSPVYKKTLHKNVLCSGKELLSTFRLPKTVKRMQKCSKKQPLRYGRPTVGELNLSFRQQVDVKSKQQRNDKKSKDLVVVCQKVERIKRKRRQSSFLQNNHTPSLLTVTLPSFPARQEFVFRGCDNSQYISEPVKIPKLPKFLRLSQTHSRSLPKNLQLLPPLPKSKNHQG